MPPEMRSISLKGFRNVETSSYVTLKSPGVQLQENLSKGCELVTQTLRLCLHGNVADAQPRRCRVER
ncbi:hypothetical protein PFLUV_G00270690 [Perca fluviatilis]|uniref:Uncharacterized protein n=1 Tax=Perca fluviatilis TaxID=8168 RepID=A0A6A5E748_PERFL|nr:hypothetical protein PFLUV_G00270690 [Perca fluviatilis]